MSARVANWPLVLAAKIEEWRFRPFEHGRSDCLQFVGDVFLALTGIDHRAKFPPYGNREEAEQIMAEYGGVFGIVRHALGRPARRARRGDIVLADFGNGLAAGICLGVHCCAPGPTGLAFRPTGIVVAAWSV